MSPDNQLERAVAAGVLRPLDLQLARWLGELAGGPTPGRLLAAALASHRVGEGNVCLELAAVAGRSPFLTLPQLRAPDLAAWRRELRDWPAVGAPGVVAPLVLDGADRLYLGRYWHYEQTLAEAVRARAQPPMGDLDPARFREGLSRLFPPEPGQAIDWQRVAAALALLRGLCVISGGPGTGKTRTVTAILALAIEQGLARGQTPRIALAAPTGKAAARLTESIRGAKAAFLAAQTLDPGLAAAIPAEALTLHRLLGSRPGRVAPRHGPDNPLHLDLLVVDEASMLDLPMAARLVAALPERCRLILIGDRDQLASVQAGSVLGDLCGPDGGASYSAELAWELESVTGLRLPAEVRAPGPGTNPGIGDGIALLRRSYRFGPDSAIRGLASAINRGDGPAALAVLDTGHPDAVRLEVVRDGDLADFIGRFVVPRHRAVLAAKDPAGALGALGAYRVLCAVREGLFGLHHLNRLAELALTAAGLIRAEGGHYVGQPLLVTANDYDLGLFNGDVGLILPDPSNGTPTAWFEGIDGPRRLSTHRLPPAETLFAMTVHKSQGSEFDDVALVLPRQDSRVLTRELIYTGVTRARRQVTVVATAERLVAGVARRLERSSGLRDALWGPG
ncbi:MAG: exodeoxyribonuclease V subunit alpha [Bdellovibrio bacteriovorus]